MKELEASARYSAVFILHGPGAIGDVAAQIRDDHLLQASISQ